MARLRRDPGLPPRSRRGRNRCRSGRRSLTRRSSRSQRNRTRIRAKGSTMTSASPAPCWRGRHGIRIGPSVQQRVLRAQTARAWEALHDDRTSCCGRLPWSTAAPPNTECASQEGKQRVPTGRFPQTINNATQTTTSFRASAANQY
jgi:hypothetical protein